MKKLIYILLFISSSYFSLFAKTDEAKAFQAFQSMKWDKAASLYFEILKTDTPLSSSEQYGRAIISATQVKDSVKTFFFINKLNEHSDYSENYVTAIEEAIDLEKNRLLYEPVLLYICSISKKEYVSILKHILEKYNKEARYEDAYRILNKILSHYPGDNKLIFSIAQLEIVLNKNDNAILSAKQMLINDPNDLDANLFLGNLHLKKYENQIDSLKKELRLKKSTLKRSDLIDYQLSMNQIIQTCLNPADYFLHRANLIKSNFYIRENLDRIKKIREENTRAMIRFKLINEDTPLP